MALKEFMCPVLVGEDAECGKKVLLDPEKDAGVRKSLHRFDQPSHGGYVAFGPGERLIVFRTQRELNLWREGLSD